MSKPYEKLISFCEAEMINPTSKVAKVEDFGVGYTIRFPVLHTSIDIYKPDEADRIDSAAAMLGGNRGQYRRDKRFEPLCEMLGLDRQWKKVVDVIVPNDKPLLGYVRFDGVWSKKGKVLPVSGFTEEYSLGYFRHGYWYGGGEILRRPTHVMDPPTPPID